MADFTCRSAVAFVHRSCRLGELFVELTVLFIPCWKKSWRIASCTYLWPEDAEKEIESIMMLFRSVKSALLQGTTQQSSKLLMDKNVRLAIYI